MRNLITNKINCNLFKKIKIKQIIQKKKKNINYLMRMFELLVLSCSKKCFGQKNIKNITQRRSLAIQQNKLKLKWMLSALCQSPSVIIFHYFISIETFFGIKTKKYHLSNYVFFFFSFKFYNLFDSTATKATAASPTIQTFFY